MAHFQGFDDRNNGAGQTGSLIGIVTGIGSYLGLETLWWTAGFGPWSWSNPDLKSATIHAFFLYLIHPIFPNHIGDINHGQTWFEFHDWLVRGGANDSFFAAFWVPLTLAILIGILTAWLVVRAINRQGKNYRRGSRIV